MSSTRPPAPAWRHRLYQAFRVVSALVLLSATVVLTRWGAAPAAPRPTGHRRNRRSTPTSGRTAARTTPNRRRRATRVIHSRPLGGPELDARAVFVISSVLDGEVRVLRHSGWGEQREGQDHC